MIFMYIKKSIIVMIMLEYYYIPVKIIYLFFNGKISKILEIKNDIVYNVYWRGKSHIIKVRAFK